MALTAAPLSGARRILYVGPEGDIGTDGPLELSFSGAPPVVLDAGPDGEALAIRPGPWQDPFAPPLSEENETFVRSAGKWTAFELAGIPAWQFLIGRTLRAESIRLPADQKVIGVVLTGGDVAVRALVTADELVVTFPGQVGSSAP